ncbi:NB-ARC domain-containing protein [Streptomyces sp. NPDC050738]|uniref:ATP-binding protein n=1 Tax=Streptomyces sp. NPDC050738 TaxID=3154744 RepID=UPI0034404F4F
MPARFSTFIGRETEIGTIGRALRIRPLVTVTGVGGVGKTRLAVQAALAVQDRFPDGIWLVELAELHTEELVPRAVADALGLREQALRPLVEILADALTGKRLLLILDGCERLVTGTSALAAALTAAVPGLRILSTSRQPLTLPGEHLLPLAPFAHNGELDDAVRLFMDRAAAKSSDVVPPADQLEAVRTLCARLEGIPLAIELAAARLRLLSVEQIDAMLQDRFRLLSHHSRGAPPRHHTLRAAIGWSHELCTPAERLLWARLSVFTSSFDLEAAEAICSDADLPQQDVSGVLRELACKSILIQDGTGEHARFRMLDTVREYGRTWLRELADEDRIADRHAAFYLRLARQAEAAWSGPGQPAWYTRMTAEHPHVRAAIEHLLTHPGRGRQALELAARMWFMWVACGRLREGRLYLDRALRLDVEPCRERTRALWTCGWIAGVQVDAAGATPYLEEAAAAAAARDDPEAAAFALQWLGLVAFLRGDWDGAITLLDRAVAQHGPHTSLNPGPVPARTLLAAAWLARARTDRAVSILTEARSLCTASGEIWMRSHIDWLLAQADRAKGRFSAAVARTRDALWVQHTFHDVIGMAVALEVLAGLQASLLEADLSAHLLGSADHLRHAYAVSVAGAPFLAAIRAQATTTAREQLGSDAFGLAFAEGARMDMPEAVAYALDAPLTPPPPAPIAYRRPLSAAEVSVAQHVARGLTDRAIAERLRLDPRTVDDRIRDVLATLGLADRAELATWAAWRWPATTGADATDAPRNSGS